MHKNLIQEKASTRNTAAAEKNTELYRQILLWRKMVHIYMPGINKDEYVGEDNQSYEGKAWNIKLKLSSLFEKDKIASMSAEGIGEKE